MRIIKNNLFPISMSIIIMIVSLATYNFLVTFDGYLYLNSANYLFKNNFILEYQWLREPGYPLLLKIIGSVYQGDFMYVLAQSFMLSLSFYIYYKLFFKNIKLTYLSKIIVIVIVLNPYFLTWASTILQVASITFSLALISLMISRNMNEIKTTDVFCWVLINLFCLSIAFQIGLISIICNVFIFVRYSFRNSVKIKEIAIVTFIFFITSLTWLEYKDNVLESTKDSQSGWNIDYFSSGSQLLLPIDLKLIPTVVNHSMLLTGTAELGNRETESYGLVESVFNGGDTCGVWFPTEFTYSAAIVQNSIHTTCSLSLLNSLFSKLNFTGYILWQISSVFLWLGFVWIILMYKKDKAFIILPAYLLLISYSFLIFTIDRYILPVYIVGLFIFVSLVDYIIHKLFKYVKHLI